MQKNNSCCLVAKQRWHSVSKMMMLQDDYRFVFCPIIEASMAKVFKATLLKGSLLETISLFPIFSCSLKWLKSQYIITRSSNYKIV